MANTKTPVLDMAIGMIEKQRTETQALLRGAMGGWLPTDEGATSFSTRATSEGGGGDDKPKGRRAELIDAIAKSERKASTADSTADELAAFRKAAALRRELELFDAGVEAGKAAR